MYVCICTRIVILKESSALNDFNKALWFFFFSFLFVLGPLALKLFYLFGDLCLLLCFFPFYFRKRQKQKRKSLSEPKSTLLRFCVHTFLSSPLLRVLLPERCSHTLFFFFIAVPHFLPLIFFFFLLHSSFTHALSSCPQQDDTGMW